MSTWKISGCRNYGLNTTGKNRVSACAPLEHESGFVCVGKITCQSNCATGVQFSVPSVYSVTTVEGLRAFAKEIDVPSVDSVTTVEGLRVIAKEISFLRFVPSVDSVTTVEGLRAFAKEISFLRFVPSVDSVTTVEGLRAIVKKNDVPSVVSGTIVEGLRAFAKDKLIYLPSLFIRVSPSI